MSQLPARAPRGSLARLRLRVRTAKAHARLLEHVVGNLGLPVVGHVVVNSFRRRSAARREMLEEAVPRAALAPGALERVDPVPGGADFVFANSQLEVRFLGPDVVMQCWGPGPEPVPYSLANWPVEGASHGPWPEPSVLVADHESRGWDVVSDDLSVHVAYDGSTRISLRDGTVLRDLAPPCRSGARWQQEYEMRPGERFSGLGEQACALDLRGETLRIWNRDVGGAWGPGAGPLYTGIPVVVSTHPDGSLLSFYENSTRSVFAFGEKGAPRDRSGVASVSFAGGRLRSYTIAGPVDHLLDRYTELTGRPRVPPRWALGYHQSRWGYRSSADVREVLRGYATEKVPLSALHLDIDYMDGYRVFTVDPVRFGDLYELSEEARVEGVRIVTIVDPGVKVDPAFDLYREGQSSGYFCKDPDGSLVQGVVWPGRAAFPDFTSPRTRLWWSEQYRRLTGRGVSGFWHDMNEPASISLMGDPTLPTDTRHDFDGRGGDHGEGHNVYGLLMNRSGFEGIEKALPGRRPFIVSRSGWAGNQRFAFTWTGDTASSWQSLRQQIATVVGLGLCGVPFSGSDIGGFSGVPDDDLYLRWLQMSVFMGFCRTHSVVGAPPREPWRFDAPTRRRVGAWIRFRYRLLPYLYTLAHEAARSGAPLVRPVWWPSRAGELEAALDQYDEDGSFLLGDSLFVCPVAVPQARSRLVRVPPGRWASLWGAETGSSEFTASAPAERIPVFVRCGTVLPLDDAFADPSGSCAIEGDTEADADADADTDGESKSERPEGTGEPMRVEESHAPRLLSFHCWPDRSGEAVGVCVDDEGDGQGPTRTDRLELSRALDGGDAVVSWTRTGDFPDPQRVRVVLHGFDSERVLADGVEAGSTRSGAVECAAFQRLEFRGLRERREVGGR